MIPGSNAKAGEERKSSAGSKYVGTHKDWLNIVSFSFSIS